MTLGECFRIVSLSLCQGRKEKKGKEEERGKNKRGREGVREDRKKEGKRKQNLRLGTPEKERVIRFLFLHFLT